MPERPAAEGWTECACGSRHWGRFGAAGLLLTDGRRVVLQHRAAWSHQGGTWALPGGALHEGESAVDGALREAQEEAGVDPADVEVRATWVLRHPDWSYTTVLARTRRPLAVGATDAESVEVAWVPRAQVGDRELLGAFARAWPALEPLLDVAAHLVIDAANVVGSRPDGWWRDRLGATRRLLARLDTQADGGVPAALLDLPGERWWPAWHAVTEGAARAAEASEHVQVHPAPGSGDDEIVALAARLHGPHAHVVVVTADRGLSERVRVEGATVAGPGGLLRLLDESDARRAR